jgi:hypothetical protein
MKRLLVALLLWPSLAWAADTCEDNLRTAKVALDQLSASRTRGETEAAQVISRLLKQIEGLQAQVELLLKAKDAK